ncbi:predicted protein [Plenodomus lingam JN3]|uniref:Predicted protein n=1 Tax=Leptosphaeria maculans (strain JN3 / isolate v23.1.3 / race Av1-4-5-6-7-8) TaxID=985895 RepID=E4ZLT2_LEPMJ|nr:predicted protein [Plenodomus lingam JN3]CBX92762.1 predicted protein [Plenodomus lingam JN3]
MMNHFTMNMNMSFPQPRGPVMAGHYEPQLEQQQQLLQLQPQPQPQPHQHQPQQQQSQQAQMYPHQDFYPMNTDMSTAMHPAQNGQGPSALELTSQISLQQQQQYDMQHALRSIPEANQSAAYHPNAVMHSIMAATNGAYLQNTGMPMDPQNHGFPYDTTGISQSYPADLDFSVPAQASHDFAPSHPEFTNFADFSVDYSSITGADANPSHSADLQHSTGSQSSDASPFSVPTTAAACPARAVVGQTAWPEGLQRGRTWRWRFEPFHSPPESTLPPPPSHLPPFCHGTILTRAALCCQTPRQQRAVLACRIGTPSLLCCRPRAPLTTRREKTWLGTRF